jgi:cobalt transporter subunit CbtA
MTGLLAGLAAGIVLTLLYVAKIQPLILAAENYEQSADAALSAPFMRYVDAFLFNILNGVGFGLLLASSLALRGKPAGISHGILWGIAGFAAFVLAPAAGLPPELPGAMKAPLEDRQIWWLFTAAATAAGIALLAFQVRPAWKGAGILLILLPHVVGAPRTTVYGGTVPAELAAGYVGVSIGAMAVFWVVLGGVAGWSYDRFVAGGGEGRLSRA